jgi:4-hydroxy 2-oxovalerate aldolase
MENLMENQHSLQNSANVKILDCTIRDGGYINNWDFSLQVVKDIYRQLSRTGIDYIELGFRNSLVYNPKEDAYWVNCNEEILKEVKNGNSSLKVCVLVDFGKANVEHFLNASKSEIDLVRVAAHKHKIPEALQLLKKIQKKGYETSMQLMGYPQYSKSERTELIPLLKQHTPDFVYVADSYGSLLPDQIDSLVSPLLELNAFKVGFHPHNNLQLAFANTLEAIKSGVHVVDATLYGMGRGAGNLPIEALLSTINELQDQKHFNINPALHCVDMYLLPLKKQYEWGYQLPYMVSGSCKCHGSYAKNLVDARRYSIEDIWEALSLIKLEKPVGFDKNILTNILNKSDFEFGSATKLEGTEDSPNYAQLTIPAPASPKYANRHQGKPFLILANGPSLKKHQDQIQQFIKKNDPIILGANYLADTIIPHYHAFTNKKRFVRYAETISDQSKALVSCYFKDNFIKDYLKTEFEQISFYHGNRDEFSINKGIISNDCSSTSMLLIAVAIVMGGTQFYIAGMDGYSHKDGTGKHYFYEEKDDTNSVQFNQLRQKWGERTLKLINQYLIGAEFEGIKIITPTSYDYRR